MRKYCLARKKVDTNNLKNGDEKEKAPSSLPESTGRDETRDCKGEMQKAVV